MIATKKGVDPRDKREGDGSKKKEIAYAC